MRSTTVLKVMILVLPLSAQTQQTAQNARPKEPVATTVCKILDDPASFNDKLVQVRGYLSISFEYSILHSESCSGGIWFALADGSGPPGLAVTVWGRGVGGEKDSSGHWRPPIAVKLIRDANFEKLESYLAASAKVRPGRPCGDDCHLYQVTATFTGRIDAVSKEVHAERLKRSPSGPSDSRGFGQMGLFDAQLVVQSVKEVEAVDLAHPRKIQPNSQ